MHIFHTVARMGSFTKAAKELGISQPAVSIQVRELERTMSTTLLSRTRNGVLLTDTGETVYRYTGRIFSLADEMQYAIQDITGLRAGKLTIGSSSTPGEYILPIVIGEFRKRYPDVDVSLSIANTQRIIDRVLNRDLDIGMAGAPVSIKGVASFPYVDDEVVLVASASHPLGLSRSVSLKDVASEPFIMRESGSATRRAAEKALAKSGSNIKVAMELASNEAVKRAASAGLGIGVVSKYAIGPDVAAGLLRALRVDGWACRRKLTVFYRDDTHITAAQSAFLTVLETEKPLPPTLP